MFFCSISEGTNNVAIDLIVKHISNQLEKVKTDFQFLALFEII